MLPGEIDTTVLLTKPHSGSDRDPDFVRMIPGDQRKGQLRIVAAEPERPSAGMSSVWRILASNRQLPRVHRPGTSLCEEVAIGTRPGMVETLGPQIQLRSWMPAQPQTEAVGQVDLGDPARILVHIHMSIGPGNRPHREAAPELTEETQREAKTRIRDLSSLGAGEIGRIIEESARLQPIRARENMEGTAKHPSVMDPV